LRRQDLDELHYIAPIVNIPSILRRGILSHRRAEKVQHESVAMQEIQERRAKVKVPSERRLHEYVNLYISARNPMLYLRRSQHESLCVLQISPEVLDLNGVVIADRNASSDYCLFGPAPSALANVDKDLVFARYWTDPNPIQAFIRKSVKCAEVLVPDRLPPGFIRGTYVSGREGKRRVAALAPNLAITINGYLFFR
jgi:hypothetical protein